MSNNKIEIGDFPKLSVQAANFSQYEDQFLKEICTTAGIAGDQIKQNRAIDLRFPVKPDQNDFHFNKDTGVPTHPKYRRDTTGFTFAQAASPAPLPTTASNTVGMTLRNRALPGPSGLTAPTQTAAQIRALTAAALQPGATLATVNAALATAITASNSAAATVATAATAATPAQITAANAAVITVIQLQAAAAALVIDQYDSDYFDLPLADNAATLYEKHLSEWSSDLKDAIQSDNDLLQFLHSTHTKEAKISIEASPLHVPYPPGCYTKSLQYWNISRSIHETGNAAVKLQRTRATFQLRQGDMRHEAFMDAINKAHRNLTADFATLVQPGHSLDGKYVIQVDHLMSLIYLSGVDQKFFAHILHKVLDVNATGKFDDTAALIQEFHAYQVTHDLTVAPSGAPREKGNRALAATASDTASGSAPPRPDGTSGCTICYDMGFTKKAQGHSNANCINNKHGSNYDAAKHKSNVEFAAKNLKKGKKTAEDKPTAHAAVAAPAATPPAPPAPLLTTARYLALQAYLQTCPEKTAARANAAADIAAYLASNGVDEAESTA